MKFKKTKSGLMAYKPPRMIWHQGDCLILRSKNNIVWTAAILLLTITIIFIAWSTQNYFLISLVPFIFFYVRNPFRYDSLTRFYPVLNNNYKTHKVFRIGNAAIVKINHLIFCPKLEDTELVLNELKEMEKGNQFM